MGIEASKMSEIKNIKLPDNLRVRLDWFDGPEIFGVRAKKALLVSLDFTKPPSSGNLELFGEDCDLYDFHTEQRRASALLGFPWDAPRMRPPITAQIDELDPKNHFPFDLIFIDPEEKMPHQPYSDVITHDSPLGCFVRERYNGDWGAFQTAWERLGFDGGRIYHRQCESCERPVHSEDPAISFCRHCVPRPPDPEEPSNYSFWLERKFRAELPRFNSLGEIEKTIKKTKLEWFFHCSGDELESPDFALGALGWFFYEGLYGNFEKNAFICGAALTTAEILVEQHGFSWLLEDGVAFITHPAIAVPVKVGDILTVYGFSPERDGDEPDLDDICRNAIKALTHAAWPPLDAAEACHYPEIDNGVNEKKALKLFHEVGAEGLEIDYDALTFTFRTPKEKRRFFTKYSGNFQYRDGHWVAVIDSSGVEEETLEDDGPPPVIAAAESGDMEELRKIIDAEPKLLHYHGGDFDIGTFSVDTPLSAAAANGHVEAVRFLLERGVRPFKKPHHPCSALRRACAEGHLAVVELLLKHGVPAESLPNTEIKANSILSPLKMLASIREEFLDDAPTPLEEAAKHNHPEIVKLLLAHGADPLRRQGLTGQIPLHWSYQFPEVLDVFLQAGVPLDARDKFGKTALHQATVFGTLYDKFKGQGMADDDEFMSEAKLYRKAVEHLIELGADINVRDDKGETPFHLAAQDGSKEYLQYFLDHGADPAARTNDGKTPLDYAEERNNRDAIALLTEMIT